MEDYRQLLDNIFEAISTIVNKKIESLKYDRTISAKIKGRHYDDTKELYSYILSDGATYFEAFSKDKYEKEISVYVLIPENDFRNTKFIIGKKI